MTIIDLTFGLEDQPWMDRAYCARDDVDAGLWFAENQDEGEGEPEWAISKTREAKRLCRTKCPVAAECMRYALDNEERWGVWGGLSEGERARARANGGKTTCEKNHPGEPSDIAYRPNGAERCNACQRARNAGNYRPPAPEVCERNHPGEKPELTNRPDGRFWCRACNRANLRASRKKAA